MIYEYDLPTLGIMEIPTNPQRDQYRIILVKGEFVSCIGSGITKSSAISNTLQNLDAYKTIIRELQK